MKRIVMICAVSLLSCGAASAEDTQAAWQGFFTVTKVTSACSGVGGAAVGDANASIYRPKIAATDTGTSLTVVYGRSAFGLTVNDDTKTPQMRGSGACTFNAFNSRGKVFKYTGCTFSSVTTSPTSVAASTSFVTVTGTINNFWSVTGCNVGFTGMYGKRVN